MRQVLGVSKLKTKYKQYEAKRQLLGGYDRFLADDRVVPLLARLLGSKFWQRKRYHSPMQAHGCLSVGACMYVCHAMSPC
jgi:ribosome biogenesis protein UTP30